MCKVSKVGYIQREELFFLHEIMDFLSSDVVKRNGQMGHCCQGSFHNNDQFTDHYLLFVSSCKVITYVFKMFLTINASLLTKGGTKNQFPAILRSSGNLWVCKMKPMQKCLHEAGSKTESISIHLHVKLFTAWCTIFLNDIEA